MNPKRWDHFDSDGARSLGGDAAAATHPTCQHPGCDAPGDYRAPRSRHRPGEYWLFCLDHVRAYNASWNYYDGMSDREIAESQRADLLWNRATHPFGTTPHSARQAAHPFADVGGGAYRDPMDLLERFLRESADQSANRQRSSGRAADPSAVRAARARAQLPPQVRQALALFELQAPVSAAEVKKTYKQLAKRYHPDLNGLQADEERLKAVNDAYQHIKEGVTL